MDEDIDRYITQVSRNLTLPKTSGYRRASEQVYMTLLYIYF